MSREVGTTAATDSADRRTVRLDKIAQPQLPTDGWRRIEFDRGGEGGRNQVGSGGEIGATSLFNARTEVTPISLRHAFRQAQASAIEARPSAAVRSADGSGTVTGMTTANSPNWSTADEGLGGL
jgi:hypothetical protein